MRNVGDSARRLRAFRKLKRMKKMKIGKQVANKLQTKVGIRPRSAPGLQKLLQVLASEETSFPDRPEAYGHPNGHVSPETSPF